MKKLKLSILSMCLFGASVNASGYTELEILNVSDIKKELPKEWSIGPSNLNDLDDSMMKPSSKKFKEKEMKPHYKIGFLYNYKQELNSGDGVGLVGSINYNNIELTTSYSHGNGEFSELLKDDNSLISEEIDSDFREFNFGIDYTIFSSKFNDFNVGAKYKLTKFYQSDFKDENSFFVGFSGSARVTDTLSLLGVVDYKVFDDFNKYVVGDGYLVNSSMYDDLTYELVMKYSPHDVFSIHAGYTGGSDFSKGVVAGFSYNF